MKLLKFVAVISLPLVGCVAQNMNKGLDALVGQNISQAVAELGYPEGQRTMMGNTIYVWGSSRNVDLPMSQYNTTTGYVGGVPYSQTTATTAYMPANFNCTIEIAADSSGQIVHTQWTGNMGGCSPYARQLNSN